MMRKNKTLFLLGLLILLIGTLLWVNRDLMHYEYRFPYERNFDPKVDSKGIHLITGEITLRPGTYQLELLGELDSWGNSWVLSDLNGEIVSEGPIALSAGDETLLADLTVSDARPMRVGVRYEPDGGVLTLTDIRLSSDHVLYKESLTRHAFLSVLILFVVLYAAAHICFPQKFTSIRKQELITLYLLLIGLLSSLPMFDPTVSPFGDDLMFHLSRIDGVAATLKAGIFPTKIYLSWMQDYGVGSGLFYPDLFITIPAVFNLLGFSLVTSCKIFYFLSSFFSGLTAYVAAKRMSGGKRSAGLIAASLYVFASYRLICIYYRQALGEVQAFVFYPLIIYGLFEILRGNVQKWLWFAFGFWGLLCTHLISVAIAGLVVFAYLLFCLPRILRNKKILGVLVLSVLVVVLAGGFFLFPMMEQYGKVDLYLTQFLDDPNSTVGSLHFMQAKTLLKVFDRWICDGTGDHPYPGWPLLAAFVLCFIPSIRKKKEIVSVPNRMLILALVTLFASTETFPWMFFRWFIFRIQFSWRFLTMSTVLLTMCVALYVSAWMEDTDDVSRRKWTVFACVIPFLFGAPLLIEAYLHHTQPIGNLSMEDKEISGAEYMPVALDTPYVYRNRDTVQFTDENVLILSHKRSGLSFRFDYDGAAKDSDLKFEVPLIYYYGYQAEYEDQEGERKVLETFAGPNGLVSVDCSGYPNGSVWVGYRLTSVQKISYAVSLLTVLACAAWAFAQKGKKIHAR